MHDIVALLQDVRTKHFESGQALLLRRGQIGTVVMTYVFDSGVEQYPWNKSGSRRERGIVTQQSTGEFC